VQPGGAGDIACLLASLGDTAAGDLLDLVGLKPGTFQEGTLGVAE